MKRKILPLLFLFFSPGLFAQKQWNNWYFGNETAVTFNGGAPVSFSGSQMTTYECAGSISDARGNLLFYSNGGSVWNRNNTVTPNGTGLTSRVGSAQGALIVPNPADTNQYYIFCAGEYGSGGVDGYKYSIFDMTLNSGLGDVTGTKNVLLYTPASEKQVATPNAEGTGYWIITHQPFTDTFVVYQLTAAGISAPVYSVTGTSYATNGAMGSLFGISFDGTKLATGIEGLGTLEYYSFDNNTGIVSNAVNLGRVTSSNSVYSCVFSPDGTKLYCEEENTHWLWQYDLSAGDSAAIVASKTAVGTTSGNALQQMQNGPDGKIYICREGEMYLATVNNPNAAGIACDYVDDGLYLDGTLCAYGLPSVIHSFFLNGFTAINTCFGDSTSFTPTNSGPDSVLWNFGDTASGAANTSNQVTAYHQFSTPGTFLVTLVYFSGGNADTIMNQVNINSIPQVNLGPDTTLCTGQSLTLNAGNAGATYLWQDSSTAQTLSVSQSATYSVNVSENGCSAFDSVHVNFESNITFSLGNDTTICAPHTLVLNPNINGAAYQWQDSTTSSTYTVSQPGLYSVTISLNGCFSSDSIQVNFSSPAVAANAPATQLCPGDTAFICATPGFVIYNWNQGNTTSCISTTEAGNYTVTVTDNNGCTAASNQVGILFFAQIPVSVSDIGDTLSCFSGFTHQWYLDGNPLPGDTQQVLVASQPGTYTAVIEDTNGCYYTSTGLIITGIGNITAGNNIKIYPNPLISGNWQLEVDEHLIGATLEMFDAQGRLVYQGVIQNITSDIPAGLASGVYLLHVNTVHASFVTKLVKL